VVFAIDRAGLVGADGMTHQGVYDLAYLRPIPNLSIAMPKDALELRSMLKGALARGGPVAVRWPRGGCRPRSRRGRRRLARHRLGDLGGRGRRSTRDGAVAVLAFGATLPYAIEAAGGAPRRRGRQRPLPEAARRALLDRLAAAGTPS
jgi:1-deoxy-D-xylulose-5-phosphate synthase